MNIKTIHRFIKQNKTKQNKTQKTKETQKHYTAGGHLERQMSVCVMSLSVFAGGPTGLALDMVFRLLIKGYTGDHWTHGGREETGYMSGG